MRTSSSFLLLVAGAAGFFTAGMAFGYSLKIPPSAQIPQMISTSAGAVQVVEQGVHYQFINPLLFCQDQNVDNGFTDAVAQNIQKSVRTYIDNETQAGTLVDGSLYYLDLNQGPSTTVYPNVESAPASLLKVPLAISVYEKTAIQPDFLDSKMLYKGGTDYNATEHFQPPQHIVAGKTYTVSELLQYMLEDSDNNALYLLSSLLSQEELTSTYSNLGVTIPTNANPDYQISAKTYASFFRVLYNASYLDKIPSEQLLNTLSQSKFTQGLVAGLPAGTVVAHKFGEGTLMNGQKQLNDCGIVYLSNSPYLLCVMVHGYDFETLASVITHISNVVYQIVEQQNQPS